MGVYERTVTQKIPIQIVTFNYDTILEHVLEQQFANTEDGPELFADYQNLIKIHHVHEQFGPLEPLIHYPAQTCVQWSTGIHVIRETEGLPQEVSEKREFIYSLVTNSSQIYCCGFAFAKANMEMIGLEAEKRPEFEQHMYYTNYDNSPGLHLAAKKYEWSNPLGSIGKITPYTNVGVADWIGSGAIGEMP